jgi:hypothetical protein
MAVGAALAPSALPKAGGPSLGSKAAVKAGAPSSSFTPAPTSGTAPSSPIQEPDLDTLVLGGKTLPGVWEIKPSDIGPKLDKAGAGTKGQTGAKVTAAGIKLAKFSIEGTFWSLDQVDQAKAILVPLVRPKNPKSIGPVTADHWLLRVFEVTALVIEDAPGPFHKGRGVWTWSIKADEFRPPVKGGGGLGFANAKKNAVNKALFEQQLVVQQAVAMKNQALFLGQKQFNQQLNQNGFFGPPSASWFSP